MKTEDFSSLASGDKCKKAPCAMLTRALRRCKDAFAGSPKVQSTTLRSVEISGSVLSRSDSSVAPLYEITDRQSGGNEKNKRSSRGGINAINNLEKPQRSRAVRGFRRV